MTARCARTNSGRGDRDRPHPACPPPPPTLPSPSLRGEPHAVELPGSHLALAHALRRERRGSVRGGRERPHLPSATPVATPTLASCRPSPFCQRISSRSPPATDRPFIFVPSPSPPTPHAMAMSQRSTMRRAASGVAASRRWVLVIAPRAPRAPSWAHLASALVAPTFLGTFRVPSSPLVERLPAI
eukprot:361791-Chlamydomonas_euryale.AAC.5